MAQRPHDPHRVFYLIKLYAFESALTILFLYALWRLLDYETGLGRIIMAWLG